MKRFIVLVVMLAVIASNAFASSEEGIRTLRLTEIDVSIDIPDYLIAITRSMTLEDSGLLEYGVSQDMLNEYIEEMISSGIYLSTIDPNFSVELESTSNSQFQSILENLSEEALPAINSTFETTYTKGGASFIGAEIYHHEQVDFLSVASTITYDGRPVFSIQFMTTYKGKVYDITFNIVDIPIDSVLGLVYYIVDSMSFGISSNVPENESIFKDEVKGIQFTVPAHWIYNPSSVTDEHGVIYTSFSLNNNYIVYSYVEIPLNDLSLYEKILYSLNKLNNANLTDEDLAMFAKEIGFDPVYGSRVEYNGIEYYKVDISNITGIGNVSGIALIRFDNLRIHTFVTTFNESSAYYKDFESLLASVEYSSGIDSE